MKKSAFKAGMYLLETLTAGMYNDPLAIYREYIQNAADSIDIALQTNPWNSKRIHVDLDPAEKSITICDKGAGISAGLAKDILSSVGLSSKTNQVSGDSGELVGWRACLLRQCCFPYKGKRGGGRVNSGVGLQ